MLPLPPRRRGVASDFSEFAVKAKFYSRRISGGEGREGGIFYRPHVTCYPPKLCGDATLARLAPAALESRHRPARELIPLNRILSQTWPVCQSA